MACFVGPLTHDVNLVAIRKRRLVVGSSRWRGREELDCGVGEQSKMLGAWATAAAAGPRRPAEREANAVRAHARYAEEAEADEERAVARAEQGKAKGKAGPSRRHHHYCAAKIVNRSSSEAPRSITLRRRCCWGWKRMFIELIRARQASKNEQNKEARRGSLGEGRGGR